MGVQPFTEVATIADRVVVLEPGAGTETGTNFEVSGYARTFEGGVMVIAVNAGEGPGVGQSTQAADGAETWGEFRTSLEVAPGIYMLHVGEENLDDPTISGATVEITAR